MGEAPEWMKSPPEGRIQIHILCLDENRIKGVKCAGGVLQIDRHGDSAAEVQLIRYEQAIDLWVTKHEPAVCVKVWLQKVPRRMSRISRRRKQPPYKVPDYWEYYGDYYTEGRRNLQETQFATAE